MTNAEVAQFVNEHGAPAVVSLADDIHIYHFSADGDWESCPVLLVNRNGHHFRVFNEDGTWLFAKTWNTLFETQPWQVEAQLRRPDVEKLINLCGIGPQGNRGQQFEALSLLPREVTVGRRKAVWRQNMIDVLFDRDNNSFALILEDGSRQTFKGKPWESQDAASFCRGVFGAVAVQVAKRHQPLTQDQTAVLEDNPLWGMF